MILKKGSKGEQVKVLQEFLGIKADGDFGSKTDKAVKKWQKEHGLEPDGIVGKLTWEAMAIASTDISETVIPVNTALDIKEFHLPSGEYFSGPTKKEWLFLHHTAGWNNPYNVVSDWGRDSRGAVGTEFVIGGQSIRGNDVRFDGEVVQAIPIGGYGWHLGTGNDLMHRNSVGIEICAFGQLTKGGYHKMINNVRTWIKMNPTKFYTYTGAVADSSQIAHLDQPFRNYSQYHRYSVNQISALKELILFIADRDSIDVRKGLPELIQLHGPAAFNLCNLQLARSTKGLWSHTNVRSDKVDVFPQPELLEMLTEL